MKPLLAAFALLTTLFIASTGRSDVLVLAHGYLGSAASWERSGVVPMLVQKGWERAGILSLGPGGVTEVSGTGRKAEKKIYLVELPSIAPLGLQADHLTPMWRLLAQRHPNEPLILVGHSAGGVVLRLSLVRGEVPNPKALITIASPHLGTPRAEQALNATDDPWPIEILRDFFDDGDYRTLRVSRGLYLDIVRQHPGSLLFWLNHQPHPDIRYISIVRGGPFAMGDFLVPGISQDLNNVPVLRGKATSRIAGAGHELFWPDGQLLASLLEKLPQ